MELIFESERSFEICLEKSPKNKKGDPERVHLKTVVLGGAEKKDSYQVQLAQKTDEVFEEE